MQAYECHGLRSLSYMAYAVDYRINVLRAFNGKRIILSNVFIKDVSGRCQAAYLAGAILLVRIGLCYVFCAKVKDFQDQSRYEFTDFSATYLSIVVLLVSPSSLLLSSFARFFPILSPA